jgi:hypothetical protein
MGSIVDRTREHVVVSQAQTDIHLLLAEVRQLQAELRDRSQRPPEPFRRVLQARLRQALEQ